MMPTTGRRQLIGLAAWLAVTVAAAAIGAAASASAGPFYLQLVRPRWAPPPSAFGPVWTALYLLMATAAWLVWRIAGFRAAHTALALYLAQLAANALWTWLFFVWALGALAFADVLLLWALVLATLVSFWRARPLAGVLLLPYLLWAGFAAALSFAVWRLNPHVLGR